VELVDEGLTPIIQVPDVAVSKVFKSAVKGKYHTYRSGKTIKIDKKGIRISRDNGALQIRSHFGQKNQELR